MKHAVIIEIAFAVVLALTGVVVTTPPSPPPPVSTPICSQPPCRGDDPLGSARDGPSDDAAAPLNLLRER